MIWRSGSTGAKRPERKKFWEMNMDGGVRGLEVGGRCRGAVKEDTARSTRHNKGREMVALVG